MILHNVKNYFIQGDLKLIDFGCSRFLASNQRATSLVGTSEYFSPEMFKENYGFQSDIWAFAVIAYELITGDIPFTYPENISNEEEKFFLLAKKLNQKNRKKI